MSENLRRRPSVPHLFAVATALLLLAGARAPHAQTLDTTMWVPNGEVKAILRVGNTIYLGGAFTEIGPPTGSGVGIQYPSGAVVPGFPKVTGTVNCVVPDGNGGWYIGGAFTRVNGLVRNNAAHIRADLTVSGWDPNVTSTGGLRVNAIVVYGSRVYLGGFFNGVGGQTRNNIAAVDRVTGAPVSWNPNANSEVNALAANGTNLVLGGRFTSVGGQTRNRIAQVDTIGALATAWNPNANLDVTGVVVNGTTIYAFGDFTTIGGQTRPQLAALDAGTGLATAWNPRPLSRVRALVVRNGVVYVGGDFTSFFSGAARNYLAAIDATSGTVTPWNPNVGNWPLNSPRVRALAFNGPHLLVGGAFTTVGGQTRTCLAEVDTATALARAWDPHAGSDVQTLAVNGSTVFAGGLFLSMGGVSRLRAAALDAATGAATGWNPNASARLLGLAEQSGTIYTIGEFTSIGGASRFQIAALDGVTGAATSWNPQAFGGGAFLYSIAATPSTVYIGGDYSFTFGASTTRADLVALDRTTALPLPLWDPRPVDGGTNAVWTIVPQGDRLYVGGSFGYIGGLPWKNLAALDSLTSQAEYGWSPNPDGIVSSLAFGGGALYASGSYTTIGGQARSGLAAVDPATGLATPWNPALVGSVAKLDSGNGLLFAVGQVSQILGQASKGASAVDLATGLPIAWTPDPNGGGLINALDAYGQSVYLGGSFSQMDGRPVGCLAAYHFPQPTAGVPRATDRALAVRTWPNPFVERLSVAFVLPQPQSVRMEVLDVAGRRVWSTRDEYRAAGAQALAWDGTLEGTHARAGSGVYFVRVVGDQFEATKRIVRVQ